MSDLTPNVTPPIDPSRCPLGCLLDGERRGTCEALQASGERGRICGYAATVCQRAWEAWRDADRPSLTRADLERVAPRPAAPRLEASPDRLPAIFEGLPASIAALTLVPDSERLADGTSAQALQQEYLSRAIALEEGDWKAARAAGEPWLLFLGRTGAGKTTVLRLLGRRALLAGLGVRYVLFEDMLKAVKATRDPDASMSEEAVVETFVRPDILIVDDIRPVFNSQDDENIAHDVIKARYAVDLGQRRKMTWAASNLTVSELVAVVGVPAVDRFLHGDTEPWFFAWSSFRPLEGAA